MIDRFRAELSRLLAVTLLLGATMALSSISQAQSLTGDAAAGKEKSATCAACHGSDGKALQPENPNLAGQGSAYLVKQLQDYKSGARDNAIMKGMASPLSEQDMADIAAWFSSLPPVAGVAEDDDTLTLGKNIYRGGITSAGIAACIGCHGPSGKGNPASAYPQLAGQNSSYTYTSLQQFRAGTRANDPNSMMRSLAHRLSNEEIAAVANYIQGLH